MALIAAVPEIAESLAVAAPEATAAVEATGSSFLSNFVYPNIMSIASQSSYKHDFNDTFPNKEKVEQQKSLKNQVVNHFSESYLIPSIRNYTKSIN